MHNSTKPLSSIELAATKENCPALAQFLVFKDFEPNPHWTGNSVIVDKITGSQIPIGATNNITVNADGSITLIETLGGPQWFVSGGWVNPGSKTLIAIAMLGNVTTPSFIIAGDTPIAAAGTGQGIRTNRNALTVTGNNLADFAATAPTLTSNDAMVGLRFTPSVSINSMEADDTAIVVNTPNTTTPAGPIDDLPDRAMFVHGTPFWGAMYLHCANPPSDAVIAQGMAWLRPHWLAGNFDLLPPMWKDLS